MRSVVSHRERKTGFGREEGFEGRARDDVHALNVRSSTVDDRVDGKPSKLRKHEEVSAIISPREQRDFRISVLTREGERDVH